MEVSALGTDMLGFMRIQLLCPSIETHRKTALQLLDITHAKLIEPLQFGRAREANDLIGRTISPDGAALFTTAVAIEHDHLRSVFETTLGASCKDVQLGLPVCRPRHSVVLLVEDGVISLPIAADVVVDTLGTSETGYLGRIRGKAIGLMTSRSTEYALMHVDLHIEGNGPS
jgi:hypothetical protein